MNILHCCGCNFRLYRRTFYRLGFIILMFVLNSQLYGQDSLQEGVDRQVAPYLLQNSFIGLSVGIIKADFVSTFGYGRVSQNSPLVPDGKTIFEIGSISKVFTGVLLGDAVMRKRVRLESPISELVPSEYPKPHPSVAEIQLVQLATHTSGLPRLPTNLGFANRNDPYGAYGSKELFEFLHSFESKSSPGDRMEYSNLATGLLGELLAQKSGKEYEQLLKERITRPLGMIDTVVTLDSEQEKRLATPYTSGGIATTNWSFQSMAGAGGIRSTVDDLLKFALACLNPLDDTNANSGQIGSDQNSLRELHQALQLAWRVHRDGKKPSGFAMGLNWHIAEDGTTRFHNGQTGGYHSMLFINRELDLAVVLLSNTATMEIDRLAEDIFKVAAGMEVEPRNFESAENQ